MSILHQTTMNPTKLELLTEWLPSRPWYRGGPGTPRLARVGGFRLDDPEGEVGMEFMAVADSRSVIYHVPMTYRGAPLAGAEHALIGTSEHGVLGTRWLYDGPRDPLLAGQLLALLAGRAVPQLQTGSDAPDPRVETYLAAPLPSAITEVADATGSTSIRLSADAGGEPVVRVNRVLAAESGEPAGAGHVIAEWTAPDGPRMRGRFVEVTRDA